MLGAFCRRASVDPRNGLAPQPVLLSVLDPALPLPRKLKQVQALMNQGDERARRIYETLDVYLRYALAHYKAFYDFHHVLLLGRVTLGPGGDALIDRAREVLRVEARGSPKKSLSMPDETARRHGQAVAGASLPIAAELH